MTTRSRIAKPSDTMNTWRFARSARMLTIFAIIASWVARMLFAGPVLLRYRCGHSNGG